MPRITFDVTEERLDDLEEIQQALGHDSLTDVFNNAMTLLAWGVEESERGRSIASVDTDAGEYYELVYTPFDSIQ